MQVDINLIFSQLLFYKNNFIHLIIYVNKSFKKPIYFRKSFQDLESEMNYN